MLNKRPRFSERKRTSISSVTFGEVRLDAGMLKPSKKFLEKRRKRGKFVLRAIDDINHPDRPAFMNNLAPAISPPAGIGDPKPANQAVLDWVQEVARLTQPENIFWCDGSERENDYLLERSAEAGGLDQAEPERSSRLLFAPLESERRRAGRAIHFHLHADEGGSGPDEQLGRAGRDLRETYMACSKARCAAARCLSCLTSWARRIRR